MQAYNAEIFGAPIVLHGKEELVYGPNVSQVHQQERNRVCKHGSITEQVRWRYLYETARLVWSKFEFDPEQLQELRKRRMKVQRQYDDMGDALDSVQGGDEPKHGSSGVDWTISSATSSQAQDVEADMSEKKQGKMRLPEVEEPESDIEQTSRASGEAGTSSKTILAEAQREAIRRNLDLLKQTRKDVSTHSIRGSSSTLLTQAQQADIAGLTDVTQLIGDFGPRKKELQVTGLVDHDTSFEIEVQLKDSRENLIGKSRANLHRPVEYMEADQSTVTDALSNLQQVALMHFMEITDQSIEVSISLLAANGWDAQHAISHWAQIEGFRSESTDDDFALAVLESAQWLPNEDEVQGVTGPSSSAKLSNSALAGPSNKRLAFDTPEELAASRARLEELISAEQQTRRTRSPKPPQIQGESDRSRFSQSLNTNCPASQSSKAAQMNEARNTVLDGQSKRCNIKFKYSSIDEASKGIATHPSGIEPPEENQVQYARGGTPMPSRPNPSADAIDPALSSPYKVRPTYWQFQGADPHAHPANAQCSGKRKRQLSNSIQPIRANPTAQTQFTSSSLAGHPPKQEEGMTLAEALIIAEQERRDSAIDPALQNVRWQDQESFEVDQQGQMRRKSDKGKVSIVTTRRRREVKIIEECGENEAKVAETSDGDRATNNEAKGGRS
ncbi:hypothetical protein BKA66DRAFT_458691 [Pyrenochaeta sp. MPI-SDFR-AT-0127]|nr:hypothetical protein BKA66DRAFT_458691 [Pyrenochaeta sp. MPI-SDFR-AT-0127]